VKGSIILRQCVGIALLLLAPMPAFAIDTKTAGQCVALGAMAKDYQAKAEAILAATTRAGYGELVELRAKKEFAYLARHKNDKSAQEAWIFQAVRACDAF
jgi:hypothetical protein